MEQEPQSNHHAPKTESQSAPKQDYDTQQDSAPNRNNPGIAAYAGIVLLLLAIVGLVITAHHVLFVVFAGMLIAAAFGGIAQLLTRLLRLPYRLGLILGITMLLLIGTAFVWAVGPKIINQVDQLVTQLPEMLNQVRNFLSRYEWTRQLLENQASGNLLAGGMKLLTTTTNLLGGLFGIATGILLTIFIGIYLGIEPNLYRTGTIQLMPPKYRDQGFHTLNRLVHDLQWWLLARLFSMTIIGILTGVGLWVLDIPLALTFALIAASLSFIPYIGPILSVLPPALFALSASLTKSLYVLLLFAGIQFVETYLVTPIVERRAVKLPPVLTLTAMALLQPMGGILAVLLAAPITLVIMDLVKIYYVKDPQSHARG